jgi:hypothetical protein
MTDKDKSLDQKSEEQKHTTDPQEDEKNGNVLGEAFDKLFGNAEGENSLDDPANNNE